ncbi:ABC transporter transmembrane domain-containing protein, partial [Romboutsia ilealis]|uniref:ABC transporter transmembrane domain-containing protein n=1 Tax=Romboutsia ilealis TaxID=1115758 RepID=UPI00272B8C3E
MLLGIVTSLNVYLWKYLVDSATYSLEYGKVGEAFIWLGGIGGCIETINLFNRLSIYYREIAQESMNCYINEMVIEKVNQLDMSYFDDSKIYDTLEKVSSESGARCVSILVMLVMLLQYFTTLIGVTAVMASLSGSIAIMLCLIMVPIFYVSISIAYKQYKIYVTRVQNLRMVDYLTDLCLKYENIKELKIYGAALYLKQKVSDIYKKHIIEDKKYKKSFLFKLTKTDLVQSICSTGIKIFVLYRAILEKKSIGDFTMYISALDNMENSINSILDAISSLYSDNLYIENLLDLLKMEGGLKDGKKDFSVVDLKKIEFENVWFQYP